MLALGARTACAVDQQINRSTVPDRSIDRLLHAAYAADIDVPAARRRTRQLQFVGQSLAGRPNNAKESERHAFLWLDVLRKPGADER